MKSPKALPDCVEGRDAFNRFDAGATIRAAGIQFRRSRRIEADAAAERLRDGRGATSWVALLPEDRDIGALAAVSLDKLVLTDTLGWFAQPGQLARQLMLQASGLTTDTAQISSGVANIARSSAFVRHNNDGASASRPSVIRIPP